MSRQKVAFQNEHGEQLAAYLDFPVDQRPVAYALFAHCFTCNKNLKAVNNISRSLTQKGFAVLRFDFTGLGESEGDFSDTNFSSNVADLAQASEFLREHYEAPSLLMGHSLGGAAVLLAAHKMPELKAVATVAAPANPDHVTKHFKDQIPEIKEKGEATVNLGGRDFTIRKQFVDNLERSNLQNYIHNLRSPLLILHSPSDKTVGIDNAGEIFQHAQHPKSFIALDNADHLLMKKEDSVYVGEVVASWAERYLPARQEQGLDLSTEKQAVARTDQNSLTTDVKTGNHHLLVDEPTSAGGNDLGPNPYDYLATALASCTSLTLHMYANHKQLPLEEVRVHVQHQKTYEEDCDNAEQKGSKIDLLEREIELFGRLDEKQRERLVQIANKCPVHRTLESDIKITTNERRHEP